MMREVKLYGHLGKRFGRTFKLNVESPGEAIRALAWQIKGFKDYLIEHSEPGYRVFVGERNIAQEEVCALSSDLPIKIVPHVAGAGRGFFQVILGAALIVSSFYTAGMTGWGYAALTTAARTIGASMLLNGVSQMLTRSPAMQVNNGPNNQPSYSFNGPVNTTAQGGCVPVLYGKLMVGSTVVSASFSTGDIAP